MQDKLTETRAALDRYFRALEAGTVPEDTCASHIANLSDQTKALERCANGLATQRTTTSNPSASAPTSTRYAATSTTCSTTATPKPSRACSQAMINGIRVNARDQIEPTFRVPAVRIESGCMELAGLEPATSCLQIWLERWWLVPSGHR